MRHFHLLYKLSLPWIKPVVYLALALVLLVYRYDVHVLAQTPLALSPAPLEGHPISEGMDYRIYQYFASVYFEGINPFSLPVDRSNPDPNEWYTSIDLFQYSGAQLMIFIGIYGYASLAHIPVLQSFGLYTCVLFALTLMVLALLLKRKTVTESEFMHFMMLLLVAPGVWAILFYLQYDDKALYVLFPILMIYLFEKSPRLAAGVLGIFTGIFGTAIALLPLLLLKTLALPVSFRQLPKALHTKKTWILIAFFGVGLLLSLIPFFPESGIGWYYRSLTESGNPSWFSIWNLLGDWYFPRLNLLTIGILCLGTYALFHKQWISEKAAIILTASFFFSFTSIMAGHRLVPILLTLVLVFRYALTRNLYFIAAFIFLMMYAGQPPLLNYPPAERVIYYSLAMCSTFILAYGLVVLETVYSYYQKKNSTQSSTN